MSELNLAVVAMADVEKPMERLAILFNVHYDRLYRLARRLTGSTDDALDLVQETFLKAARYLKSIPVGSTNEEAWLVRVLVNIRRDQWRKNITRSRLEATEGRQSIALENGDIERGVIVRANVWRALDGLSPRRRAIVVMRELEGMDVPAIASLLGISQITVRWHLSAGMRDLTTALKAYMEE